jgi:hypothetical protein
MRRIALVVVLLVSLDTPVWAQSAGSGINWRDFLILWGIIVAAALLFVFLKWLFRVLRLFLMR